MTSVRGRADGGLSVPTLGAAASAPQLTDMDGPQLRVALYSHDTQGLGHVRRNTLVAAAIVAARPNTDVLLITGAPEATALPLPPHTEVVTLPTLSKTRAGSYNPRVLSLSLQDVLAMREAVADAVLSAFAPDLLIVDKVARGVRGELVKALAHVREQHGTTTVLGVRDVLDGHAPTTREWTLHRTDEAIDSFYDEVWVYGDPGVFDAASEYGWPASTRAKVEYTGYLARGRSSLLRAAPPAGSVPDVHVNRPFVLGLVGGGQDGGPLALAFARAAFPPGHTGVLITGPYVGSSVLRRLARLAGRREDLRVLRFVPDVPAFVNRAAATVSMGGYNSVCELLTTARPALLVPRTVPRMEQAVRAQRLAGAGLVDVLTADRLSSRNIGDWLRTAVARPRRSRTSVDLDGLARLPDLADRLISEGARSRQTYQWAGRAYATV